MITESGRILGKLLLDQRRGELEQLDWKTGAGQY